MGGLLDNLEFVRGIGMPRGKRLILGDIYEIELPNGKKAYARLFNECTLAIYTGVYNDYAEVPQEESYFRYVSAYKKVLTDGVWKVVGNRPFSNDDDAWAPPKVVVDAITGKGRLYHKGEIKPCSFEECKNLEVVAVWDRKHIIDMLMGENKWDDSIRKPI